MAIRYYHNGRSSSETTRYDAKFYRVDRHGRMVSVSAALAGAILYLGTEIETDDYESPYEASDLVDAMRGDYCHCEHDGSLDSGFEIVTEPMTLAAHRAAKWGELFDTLTTDWGAKAHETRTCGLHVHVSRNALGNDDKAKMLCIAKLLEICEHFQKELSAFSRRDIATCHWSSPTFYCHSLSDSTRAMLRKAQEIQDRQGLGCHDDRRYRVVNLQNKNTVEFRCFKGTLNPQTFYATLALVDGLVRWCKQHTSNETHNMSWDDLIGWIADDTLTEYWATRRRFVSRYC